MTAGRPTDAPAYIRIDNGDRTLVNLAVLAFLLQRPARTLANRCPVARKVNDPTTGRWHRLYDYEECMKLMDTVPTRPRQAAA